MMTQWRYNPLMARWMLCTFLFVLAVPADAETHAELREQVRRTEIAFAKSMADRDASAFASFLSKEAVFISAKGAARGPGQVADEWKGYFQGKQAPFSWAPEQVEVLDSGKIAMSSGPVLDPQGKRIGTFTSVWRREGKGRWRIVLDKGCPACNCDGAK
jgi:ketosteroid isomerase-like protein